MLRYPSEAYPPKARIAIIDHLLGWLKKYPRYQIGFAAEGDPQRLVGSIAEEAMRLLGGDRVVVARWDPRDETLLPGGEWCLTG